LLNESAESKKNILAAFANDRRLDIEIEELYDEEMHQI